MNHTTVANDIIDSGKLDPYQGWILVRIARRGVCFESQRSISEGTNISLTQVNRTIKWLQENGYIERKKHPTMGKVGWSIVSPQEQTQQNIVPPQEQIVEDVSPGERDVIPQEQNVLPQERHLNKLNKKKNNNKKVLASPKPAATNTPYGIYEQLKAIDKGVKKGQTLREAKGLLETYSPDDIIACARFLQTDPWRITNMVTLSTQAIQEKIDKWIGAGRPANWNAWQVKAPSHQNGRNGSHMTPAPASERTPGAY
jgi:biotin operon repressor